MGHFSVAITPKTGSILDCHNQQNSNHSGSTCQRQTGILEGSPEARIVRNLLWQRQDGDFLEFIVLCCGKMTLTVTGVQLFISNCLIFGYTNPCRWNSESIFPHASLKGVVYISRS